MSFVTYKCLWLLPIGRSRALRSSILVGDEFNFYCRCVTNTRAIFGTDASAAIGSTPSKSARRPKSGLDCSWPFAKILARRSAVSLPLVEWGLEAHRYSPRSPRRARLCVRQHSVISPCFRMPPFPSCPEERPRPFVFHPSTWT